jgi:hypothetical protein
VGVAETSESSGSSGSSGSGEGTTLVDEETEGSSGGDPASCWDQPPDNWPDEAMTLDAFMDSEPEDPELSPNGLAIVYVATGQRRPFRATRNALLEPFPNGAPFVLWSDPNFFAGYPTFDLDFAEIVLSSNGDLYAAKFKPGQPNSQYEPPELIKGAANTEHDESHPNVTQDGARLLLQRSDGPALSEDLEFSWNFWELRRPTPASPLDAFEEPMMVTPHVPTLGLALCPVMSPDGLHLLFSSTDAPLLDREGAADLVSVYYTRRADLVGATWDPPVKITTIEPGGGVLCPSSVTADGCTLAYFKFPFSPTHMKYTMYLRQRPL